MHINSLADFSATIVRGFMTDITRGVFWPLYTGLHITILIVKCSVCPFTRDIDQLRAKLLSASCEDKTSLEIGLQGFVSLIQVSLFIILLSASAEDPDPS